MNSQYTGVVPFVANFFFGKKLARNVKWPTFGHKGIGHKGYNPCSSVLEEFASFLRHQVRDKPIDMQAVQTPVFTNQYLTIRRWLLGLVKGVRTTAMAIETSI